VVCRVLCEVIEAIDNTNYVGNVIKTRSQNKVSMAQTVHTALPSITCAYLEIADVSSQATS
jgi:hypothetical protein